ncbi:GyrI-like domain-containing protein [Flavobacterium cerinum]|uniref:GyrI-like small molecule binding domain-containing protein n=1 Tax=Flavobacterium cerinum TaxID=2502784 RepID=A0A444HFX7_9FLAO|nr:GyrI-like domain-containing protein [Flavobacterium cerinum]RWX03794.1 hypothetical protein EPI11_02345 [Flavobacterium cerinum]
MEKSDLTKLYKSYYSATETPKIVTFEKTQYLAILGKGDPSLKGFSDAIEALYATAYAIKFIYKALKNDFVVPKLEGLWWYDETLYKDLTIDEAPQKVKRSEWEYRLMIRMPDFVTAEVIEQVVANTAAKKLIPEVKDIHLFFLEEGKCVQALHVGPFNKEPETLNRINDFILANNLSRNGLHHEIYLSDFRKTSPDKLKTILREPVK